MNFKSLCDIPSKAWETNCIYSVEQIVTAEYMGTKKTYKICRNPCSGDIMSIHHQGTKVTNVPLSLVDKVISSNMMHDEIINGLNIGQALFDIDECVPYCIQLPRGVLHEINKDLLFPDTYNICYNVVDNEVWFNDYY